MQVLFLTSCSGPLSLVHTSPCMAPVLSLRNSCLFSANVSPCMTTVIQAAAVLFQPMYLHAWPRFSFFQAAVLFQPFIYTSTANNFQFLLWLVCGNHFYTPPALDCAIIIIKRNRLMAKCQSTQPRCELHWPPHALHIVYTAAILKTSPPMCIISAYTNCMAIASHMSLHISRRGFHPKYQSVLNLSGIM